MHFVSEQYWKKNYILYFRHVRHLELMGIKMKITVFA